jgi:hypothetical protein
MLSAVALSAAIAEARGVLRDLKAAQRTLALPGPFYQDQGRRELAAAVQRLENGLRQVELFKP